VSLRKRVGILGYGPAGNTSSIAKALHKVGATTEVVAAPRDFWNVDYLVIPGGRLFLGDHETAK